jgi:predicted RNA-binding Zn-ribbon protein involved in translation (DUF1610 family)
MNEQPSPVLCIRCGAPLPASTQSSIACPFCGVVNQMRSKATELRAAVRDVLAEDRNRNGVPDYLERPPTPPVVPTVPVAPTAPISPQPFIWVGAAIGVSVVGTVVAALVLGGRKVPPPQKPRTIATVTAPMPPQAPPPPKTWGSVGAIAFDEAGDVIATIGKNIVKADASTLTPRWIAPLEVTFGGGSSHRMFVPRGERIALVHDAAIQFFDSATGARTGQYRYDESGILQGACGVGKSQVIVSVLGGRGTTRYDALTGKKATGAGSCALRGTDLECGPNQWCGWRPVKGNGLDCRYELRAGKDVFRGCDTLDGTKRKVVVAVGAGGKPKWQTEAFLNGVTPFMGTVDGVLIVNEYRRVRALDPATGEERWSRALGDGSAVAVDATRVFYGIDGTIAATEAKTGAELARMAEQKR